MSGLNDNSSRSAAPGNASLFIWLFAIAAIWHYMSSAGEIAEAWFRFDPVRTPLLALAVVTAAIAALFPTRTWAVVTFAGGQVVAIFVRFPHVADHLVMELVLCAGILLSFAWLALRHGASGVTSDDLFRLYAPVGRWLLIVMYFFGTFHKLNPGFLSLDSSCAVPFVDGLPLPGAITGNPVVHYAGIYGTLLVEALAMLLLLSARTKYFGMLIGMSFHFAIGISGFGTLAHFSAFALALHTLFLPSTFSERVTTSVHAARRLRDSGAAPLLTILLIGLQVVCAMHLYATREPGMVNALFAVVAATLIGLVALFGRHRSEDARYRLRSPATALNALPLLYLVYCTSPYIGLGTGGSLAMFSGLRTEGGVSNHYVVREPPYLFPYQEKVLYVENVSNQSLREAAAENQGIVMFEFQRHFSAREPLLLPLEVSVGGQDYELVDPESVRRFMTDHFAPQSWIARKYMSFRLVDELRPKRCRH